MRIATVQIRIVAFLVALAFLGASVATAYYLLKKEILPEQEARRQLEVYHKDPPPPPDPAVKVFAAARELIERGEVLPAREKLLQMIDVYTDSPLVGPARDVIGEINLDQLLSRRPMPGKLDYLVKRGDVLSLIAKNHRTTVAYIQRVSPVGERVIQPGDRLVLFPMEFELTLGLTDRKLRLEHKGRFFRDYTMTQGEPPMRVKLPIKLQVTNRSATRGGERVSELDRGLVAAEKRVQFLRPGSQIGLVFASEASLEGDSDPVPLPNTVYFPDDTMEELYTILRPGLVLTVNE